MSNYVEQGYVECGYVESDCDSNMEQGSGAGSSNDIGSGAGSSNDTGNGTGPSGSNSSTNRVKLRFFIKRSDYADISVNDGEIGVIFDDTQKFISIIDVNGLINRYGGVTDEELDAIMDAIGATKSELLDTIDNKSNEAVSNAKQYTDSKIAEVNEKIVQVNGSINQIVENIDNTITTKFNEAKAQLDGSINQIVENIDNTITTKFNEAKAQHEAQITNEIDQKVNERLSEIDNDIRQSVQAEIDRALDYIQDKIEHFNLTDAIIDRIYDRLITGLLERGITQVDVKLKDSSGNVLLTPDVLIDGTNITFTIPEGVSSEGFDVTIGVRVENESDS